MADARRDIRLQAVVVAGGVLLMAVKFLAWKLTHSNTILSDALESIVNVVAGSFALYSLWLAAKPRDREHPYGHGKVEFISAGVEGGLVTLAGGLIIYRALQAWLGEHHLHDLGEGILLTLAAGLLNLLMGLALLVRGRKSHSLAMQASGTHLLSDAWTTAAMLTGLLVIWLTGLTWLDNLFAMLFGGFIIVQGIRVVRRSVAGIMDETDMDVAAEVVQMLEQHREPHWVDLHNFRVIKFGRTLHIDCHVTLPWYHDLKWSHDAINTMEELVNERSDRDVELFIHMDPCVPPASCAICTFDACDRRKAARQGRVAWDLRSVLGNAKHTVDDLQG